MVTINKEQFDQHLRQFVTISKETDEPWEILQAPSPNSDNIYASRTITQVDEYFDNNSGNCDDYLDDYMMKEDNDPLAVTKTTNLQLIRFHYHVIYSESYSVPVLYFTAFHANGSLIGIEKIWKLISSIFPLDSGDSDNEQFENSLSIISPIEHPYLATPVYYIHPCQVSTLLSNVKSGTEREREEFFLDHNLIVTWLSSVGPLVGLKLDPYYAVRLKELRNGQ